MYFFSSVLCHHELWTKPLEKLAFTLWSEHCQLDRLSIALVCPKHVHKLNSVPRSKAEKEVQLYCFYSLSILVFPLC